MFTYKNSDLGFSALISHPPVPSPSLSNRLDSRRRCVSFSALFPLSLSLQQTRLAARTGWRSERRCGAREAESGSAARRLSSNQAAVSDDEDEARRRRHRHNGDGDDPAGRPPVAAPPRPAASRPASVFVCASSGESDLASSARIWPRGSQVRRSSSKSRAVARIRCSSSSGVDPAGTERRRRPWKDSAGLWMGSAGPSMGFSFFLFFAIDLRRRAKLTASVGHGLTVTFQ